MPIIGYVAIIIVGLSSLLLELNWLTSAPPQPKPAIQTANTAPASNAAAASTAGTAVTTAQVVPVVKPPTDGPNKALSPVYPTTAGAPKFDAAENKLPQAPATPPPGAAVQTATATPQPAAATPATTSPATPSFVPVLTTIANAKAPAETTGSAPRADDATPSAVVASANAEKTGAATAAVAPMSVPPVTAPPMSVQKMGAARSCDIRACSGAYRSFRDSDCSYQPGSGPRRLCQMSREPSQRADTKRQPRVEPGWDDLRGAEAAVRRLDAESRMRGLRAESGGVEPADVDPQAVDDGSEVIVRRPRRDRHGFRVRLPW